MYGFMFTAHTPLLSVYSSKRKNFDFSALLSKVLFAFALVVFKLIYDLQVALYIGFAIFIKTDTENQSVKNLKAYPSRVAVFFKNSYSKGIHHYP